MAMAGMIVVIVVLTQLGGWLTASNGPKPPVPPTSAFVPAKPFTNSIGMQLVSIEPGEFLMGSPESDTEASSDEKPQHRVRITRPFYLGVTEVSQAQYEAVMGNNPSDFSAAGGGKDKVAGQSTGEQPVERVSWLDAVKFCNKLSELEGRMPFYEIAGKTVRVPDWKASGYRLPTEAEWEYACGGDPADLDEHAWFDKNSGDVTHPVGKKLTNRFGLHDMLGNVYEWCWDAYDKDYYKQSPRDGPTGPDIAEAADRVIRGGSWFHFPRFCRSASRGRLTPDLRSISLGFRLAAAPAPATVASVPAKPSTNSIGMQLVSIEPGEFLMGSPESDTEASSDEKPQHRVRITEAFSLGIHEVTQGQYQAVMGETPSNFKGSDDLPVENVSWLDAVKFCNKLSEREKRVPFYRIDGAEFVGASGVPLLVAVAGGNGYRLPTEAEWEYACRAGSATVYPFGNDDGNLGKHAWYNSDSEFKTHPAGQKRPNAWGLYDMLGNVLEWCGDGYDEKYYASSPPADPPGASEASARVFRGGCWSSFARYCRPAIRGWGSPVIRHAYLGFRVAAAQE